MVIKTISDTIREHSLIPEQAHLILGLSGGPDSVCLFHVLCGMAQAHGWRLYPIHVNHKFRPGAAEEDQAYTERICKEAGWPCRTFVRDCNAVAAAEKMTAEEAGRKVRYEAFAETAAALRSQGVPREKICIAVAQNADDQAETILFRLLRGAGTDGLAGIHYERTDGEGNRIIRPLLDVSRDEIESYCVAAGLAPRRDHTNSEPVYARNRIRLTLLPYLQNTYNPQVKEALIRTGKAAADDSDCLWQLAQEVFAQAVRRQDENGILLNGVILRNCHRAVRQRVLAKAFAELGLTDDIGRVHFESSEEIVFHPAPSARCSLPKGYYLTKVYGDVRAGRDADAEKQMQNLPQLHMFTQDVETFRKNPPKKGRYAAFDLDLMVCRFGENPMEQITVGFRVPGDFLPVGAQQNKKIQDYFVDRKIPRDERDSIPLLKIGHEVLWVLPGDGPVGAAGRFTSEYKMSDSTKKVICIEIIC